MADFETGRLLSAIFLGIIVVFLLLSMGGRRFQKTLQQAAIWALIFVVVIAGFGIWEDVRNDIPQQATFSEQGRVEVPQHRDGHFYLTLRINDTPINFVVDTGASEIVLTKKDAERAGLDLNALQFFGRANTANGEVRTAPVLLDDVRIGGIGDSNVPAFVNEGEMRHSLLGMSYLRRWDHIEIADGRLVLRR